MKKPLTLSLSLLGFASVLLTGCMTVQNSKTLMIRPSDAPIAVTSTARAQCRDSTDALRLLRGPGDRRRARRARSAEGCHGLHRNGLLRLLLADVHPGRRRLPVPR